MMRSECETSSSPPPVGEEPPSLDLAIRTALAAAAQVNGAALGAIDALPWRDAAVLLAILREAITDHLGPVEASLVRHLYMTAPHGQTEIDGLGVMEVQRGKDRKGWDARSGVHAYVDAKLSEQPDGEFPPPWDVVNWVLEAAGVSYLRVTALRAAHIDADQFCTSEPGKPSVRFV